MRRTRHEIMVGILKACTGNELSVSQLLATQSISHKILKPLLDILVSNDLLTYRTDQRRKLMCTTERGVATFKMYTKILAMFNGMPPDNGVQGDSAPETSVKKI